MTAESSDGTAYKVAVTGATGYIGTRLVPRLVAAGYAVRCLARSPRKLADRPWYADPRVEVVASDLGDESSLTDELIRSAVK